MVLTLDMNSFIYGVVFMHMFPPLSCHAALTLQYGLLQVTVVLVKVYTHAN